MRCLRESVIPNLLENRSQQSQKPHIAAGPFECVNPLGDTVLTNYYYTLLSVRNMTDFRLIL